MLAVYLSANQFRTDGDLTAEFLAGRRIKADCGADGIKYSTIQSSSYSNPNTTVTITESVLTSNLTDVLYGIINIGAEGSLPNHSHDNTEGQGSQISFDDLTDKSILTMEDTPGAYNNGKFLKSTTDGFVLDDTPNQTVFSGTEMFVNGDATVTGTVYAHVYDSYSPLTIKDGGVDVIVGNGAGKVDFPNGITVSGTPAVGPQGVHGVTGVPGPGWLNGTGTPSADEGTAFDYYLDDDTGDVYRKDDGTLSSNLITDQSACSASIGAAANVIIGGEMWNVYNPSEGPWWEYDFGADNDKIVVSVTLTQGWGGYSFGYGFIYGSNDGKTYFLLDYFNNGAVLGQTDTMTFVNRTVYRYIRIQYDYSIWQTSTGIAGLSMSYFTDVDWQLTGNIKGADGATSSGTSNFLALDDTPSTYSGTEGLYAYSTGSGIGFTLSSTTSGIDGVDGATWTSASGVPEQAYGNDYDYYLDESTFNIYVKDNPVLGEANVFTNAENFTASTGNPSGLLDATGATDWASTATPAWVKYDFGAGNEEPVSQLEILRMYTYFKDWEVHGSNNDSDWDLLGSGQIPEDPEGGWWDLEFSNATPYRYIRLTGTTTWWSNPRLGELYAYSAGVLDWRLIGNLKGADGATASGSGDSNITTFSGTSLHVDGDATVTGTIHAHVYDSYSPLTIKDGGVTVITGDGSGNLDFPLGNTVGGTVSNVFYNANKEKLEDTNSFHIYEGAPPSSLGGENDYCVDTTNNNAVYKKDVVVFSSTLLTTDNTTSTFFDIPDLIAGTLTGGGVSDYDPRSIYTDFGSGTEQAVSKISIRPFASDRCGKVELYGSFNNVGWVKLWEHPDLPTGYTTETFTNEVAYRYYKLDTYRDSTNHFLNHYELYSLSDVDWSDTGVVFTPTTSGVSSFTELDDTPSTYSGTEGMLAYSTGSGIEFTSVSGPVNSSDIIDDIILFGGF